MTEPPQRVRVTRPTPQRVRRASVTSEIDAQSEVGQVYMYSLVRAQLRLALGTFAALALTIGILPILFMHWTALRTGHVFGMGLPWVILGIGAYPLIGLLAWNYVRRAERNEARFRELAGLS